MLANKNEVARTCKHNLLSALQGPLEAQALQCLVEAIVGELDALSGTLDGTQVGTDSKLRVCDVHTLCNGRHAADSSVLCWLTNDMLGCGMYLCKALVYSCAVSDRGMKRHT